MSNQTDIDKLATRIQCGQVKKLIANDRGGWFLIWTADGRFRANADQFPKLPEIGSLVSFLPDARDQRLPKARLRRVAQIVFQPEVESCRL